MLNLGTAIERCNKDDLVNRVEKTNWMVDELMKRADECVYSTTI